MTLQIKQTPRHNPDTVSRFGKLSDKKYLCAMDLELTCWSDNDPEAAPREEREITEIGVVVYDLNFNEIKRLSTVVRPVLHPKISEYNTELTGITQKEVDNAPIFTEAIGHLFNKGLPQPNEFVWVTWSRDPEWLEEELVRNRMTVRFDPRYIDVKICDNAISNSRRTLKKALRAHNIPQEVPAHRALPDAVSTGLLAAKLGLSVEDSLVSNTRTYKEALEAQRDNQAKKFSEVVKCSRVKAKEVLKAARWDFQLAVNVYKAITKP